MQNKSAPCRNPIRAYDTLKSSKKALPEAFIFCAAAAVILGMGFSLSAAGSTPMDLDPFKWKNRLIFLFAPQVGDPAFSALRREISARRRAVEERDLIVFEVLESGTSRMNATPIDPQTATSLRQRFAIVPNTFTLILLGKDGGVKLRRNGPVKLEEVFALIDSMPMRQNEMRRKRDND